jgi:hypothetical protein
MNLFRGRTPESLPVLSGAFRQHPSITFWNFTISSPLAELQRSTESCIKCLVQYQEALCQAISVRASVYLCCPLPASKYTEKPLAHSQNLTVPSRIRLGNCRRTRKSPVREICFRAVYVLCQSSKIGHACPWRTNYGGTGSIERDRSPEVPEEDVR